MLKGLSDKPAHVGNPLIGEEPDEILQNEAFHNCLHCMLRLQETEINLNFMFVCVDA